MIAERVKAALGQPVIIENIAGRNGTIGGRRVARSAPDGYTLTIGHWSTHVANGASYALQYDILKDFEPISLLANQWYLIVSKKTLPADDLKGLIGWLKANPDKAS